MPSFESFDSLRLAYEVEGDGPDVVLLHGIIADGFINFVRPGVVTALAGAGFRVTTLDQRGHGASEKPHEAERYADGALQRDVVALLDHLEVSACGVLGYSMGAMITLGLLPAEPRITAAVLGGIGGNTAARRSQAGNPIADAMAAEDKTTIDNPIGKQFRDFADLVGADRRAIGALSQALHRPLETDGVDQPVLVICGDNDPLAGDPAGLADRLPNATSQIVGGSHLNVVNNHEFHTAVTAFFTAHLKGDRDG